ncbi:hypothetical protein L3X38_031985 [Prunus dulcis]|uniref:Uncharacterized protein n=1 Tax=Prunus dulcis TaxID=3755 RepID=A0AAD4YW59_PRUDU|nr:hypothetical protein L3X38_031985 [Prunus dulcis]
MRKCIDYLCQMSGQLVSFEKYMVYCSPNVEKFKDLEISQICGSPLTTNLGRYLGVPLIHERVSTGTYWGGVDNVQRRLATWKTESLSMVDRVTLIQSVTAVIPVYTMQTVKLSMTVSQELDRLNKNFIWGSRARSCVACRKWAKDQVKVYHFLDVNGWRLDQLSGLLPEAILNNIIGIHAVKDGDIEDKIRWGFIADGKFSVSSTYHNITNQFGSKDWRWSFFYGKSVLPPKSFISFGRRCKGVFEPDSHLDTPLEIGVLRDLTEWKDTIKVKAYKPSKQHSLVRWQPPSKGKYKLNTNGCRSEDGAIGVGELSKITLVLGWVASLQT